MSENVISFEGSKDPHVEAKKREKFEAMKKAFRTVRAQSNPKSSLQNKKKKQKPTKPKKKK